MSNDVFSSVFLPAFIYYARGFIYRDFYGANGLFSRQLLNRLERAWLGISTGFFVESFSIFPLLNAKYDYDDGVVKSLLHNKYWVTNAFSWASLAHTHTVEWCKLSGQESRWSGRLSIIASWIMTCSMVPRFTISQCAAAASPSEQF